METIKQLRELFNESKLHLAAIDWIEDRAEDYDNDLNAVLGDVISGGCASGIVSELIYYSDTTAFYYKHEDELWLLAQDFDSKPLNFFNSLNGSEDVLTDAQFKNLVAWWGFELACYNLQASIEQL